MSAVKCCHYRLFRHVPCPLSLPHFSWCPLSLLFPFDLTVWCFSNPTKNTGRWCKRRLEGVSHIRKLCRHITWMTYTSACSRTFISSLWPNCCDGAFIMLFLHVFNFLISSCHPLNLKYLKKKKEKNVLWIKHIVIFISTSLPLENTTQLSFHPQLMSSLFESSLFILSCILDCWN